MINAQLHRAFIVGLLSTSTADCGCPIQASLGWVKLPVVRGRVKQPVILNAAKNPRILFVIPQRSEEICFHFRTAQGPRSSEPYRFSTDFLDTTHIIEEGNIEPSAVVQECPSL